MYRLINLTDRRVYGRGALVDLFQRLDDTAYKYKNMVIVDETGQICAGKARAFEAAKLAGFTI